MPNRFVRLLTLPFESLLRSFLRSSLRFLCLAGLLAIHPLLTFSQTTSTASGPGQKETAADETHPSRVATADSTKTASGTANEYRIGPDDLVEINVFEAEELNRKLRVSATGELSVPLIGVVHSGGLTAQELEAVLESRLREYLKEPHVGVFVSAVESHPISVLGAVKKPGVFQVRGPKTVLEMLSMAEGLADDAGDAVLVMRGAGLQTGQHVKDENPVGPGQAAPAAETGALDDTNRDVQEGAPGRTVRINLKTLLQSEDAQVNVVVYPGDIVKVVKAGIVYVVGEVKRPGGFALKSDERMTVLKAIALAEGLTPTSAKSGARIIKQGVHGPAQDEIPLDLGKILAGKAPDPILSASDIVFVPNSSSKTAAYKGSQAAISALISLMIFRW